MLTDEQKAFIRENSQEVQKELHLFASEKILAKEVSNRNSLIANDLDPGTHSVGTWYCPDSPLGVCIYSDDSPMGDDECVFCGEPDERK